MEQNKSPIVKDVKHNTIQSGSSVGLFADKPHFLFLSKKTQKLASAIYLITNVLDNDDPIKSEVRKIAVILVSLVVDLKDENPVLYKNEVEEIKRNVFKIVSLLEVGSSAGSLSEMNVNVVSRECTILIKNLNETPVETGIFPDGFFNLPHGHAHKAIAKPEQHESFTDIGHKGSEYDEFGVWRKGQGLLSVIHANRPNQKDRPIDRKSNEERKSSRRKLILGLFNSKSEIEIKDVVSVLKDSGKKTAQRELLSLVSEGVLKKDGSKRWSKYRLA